MPGGDGSGTGVAGFPLTRRLVDPAGDRALSTPAR